MKKWFYSASAFALSAAPLAASAQGGGLDQINDQIGLGGDTDLIDVIARVINILLGFLGVIALVIIIYAGFKWMTAGGNEENVSSAKKMLGAGVIGLVIIVMSLAIANWVINNLQEATNSNF